jgi:iron complex transport system ATP-binding protein
VLQTINLTIKNGNKPLCQDLNWHIQAGEWWCVLGNNGCGKSTLLHTLAGLHPTVKGNVLLGNQPLTSFSSHSIASYLGILLQHPEYSFNQTIFETTLAARYPHLKPWRKETRNDVLQAMNALQCMGLQDKTQFKMNQLSGGERQRVAISSLLTQDPDIYLMDEPLTHLDLKHQIQVLNHFKQLVCDRKKSIVMVIHDINLADRFCDKALLLFDNNTHLCGNISDLFQTDLLNKLYQCTFKKTADAWVHE